MMCGELVRIKRDNFRFDIRRQKTEVIFQSKRSKHLRIQMNQELDMNEKHTLMESVLLLMDTLDISQELQELEYKLISLSNFTCQLLKIEVRQQKSPSLYMSELVELMIARNVLDYVVQLTSMAFPKKIIQNTLWILTNLVLADGIASKLVFDTILLQNLLQILNSGDADLIQNGLEVLVNLIADNDTQIYEYMLDYPQFIDVLFQLSVQRDPYYRKELGQSLLQLILQIVHNYESYCELESFSVLVNCLSQLSKEIEAVNALSAILDENQIHPEYSSTSALYIIENHFGFVAKLFNNLEKFIGQCDNLNYIKQTLKIAIQLSDKYDTHIEQTLIQLRIIQIISKILATKNDQLLSNVCEVIINLSSNTLFCDEVSPFIIQEVMRLTGEDYPLKNISITALCSLIVAFDAEKLSFTIELGCIRVLLSNLGDIEVQLSCLHALNQILSSEDPKTRLNINMQQGGRMIDKLTHSSNPEVSQKALSILTRYPDIDLY